MPHDHPHPAGAAALSDGGPILVEVTRGAMVESRHRGHAAVLDPDGGVVMAWGDAEEVIYPRSAIKPLQALPLVESGAADALGLGDAELALACASHGGEPRHVKTVSDWLARAGLSVDDLECGGHWPSYAPAARDIAAAGETPTAVHNNCSGKHAGMLSTARHLGEKTNGYIDFAHPVQQRVLGILEQLTGADLAAAPRGIDGCSLPIYGTRLGNLALAFARFADPAKLPPARAEAIARIRAAMASEPFMVAGTGRFCTAVMEVTGADAAIKTGAEGVYCGALPGLGLGVALKIEDGATRAAEVAMAAILRRLGVLDEARAAQLADRLEVPLSNWAGRRVGAVRPGGALTDP